MPHYTRAKRLGIGGGNDLMSSESSETRKRVTVRCPDCKWKSRSRRYNPDDHESKGYGFCLPCEGNGAKVPMERYEGILAARRAAEARRQLDAHTRGSQVVHVEMDLGPTERKAFKGVFKDHTFKDGGR